MKATRKLITVNEDLCNGCGNCVTGCAEGALAIIDGKAKLVNEVFCDGLGACLGECPTGALKVVEVEVEDFDPDAVAKHLKSQGRAVPDHMPDPASLRLDGPRPVQGGVPPKPHGGCPGSRVMSMGQGQASPCQQANVPRQQASAASSLAHWPIQLRLVPPSAPFLQNASLLLTADCVPPSLPDFNARFLPGRVLLLGCPKFDDAQSYIDKVADILRHNASRHHRAAHGGSLLRGPDRHRPARGAGSRLGRGDQDHRHQPRRPDFGPRAGHAPPRPFWPLAIS